MAEAQARRICVFLASLEGGGAERVMVTLANGFAARGRMVTMVLGEGAGPFRDDLDPAVELVDLSCRHVSLALPRLAIILRQRKPDVLLSALHVANLVALLAARLARRRMPVVVSEHSSLASILGSRAGLRRRILRSSIGLLYPRAARVVTVSRGAAAELRQLFPAVPLSIETIPNPIDIGAVRVRAKDKDAALPNEPFIIAVGRLVPEKRFDDLIQAFGIVQGQVQCRLEILGEGPERGRLEALCDRMGLAGAVSLPGFARNPFPRVRAASVLAVTSEREGFGNVLVEAMALGTSVVASDCPHGPREILEGGRWGHLVPVGDPNALAAALLDTLRAPPVAPDALKKRAEAFDKDHAIDAYLALLDDAASEATQSI
ncbi:MAG TPA: glycosyltransferase [Alphaproteobacteria bacterium]|nr:glycosyltransferase [Alphaproteobacteria bacterium]